MQARVLRHRVLNLACLVLTVFNGFLEIWPMVPTNLVLSANSLWFIVRLLREQDDEAVFTVLEMRPDDTYLRHVLSVHADDIARFQPDLNSAQLRDRDTSAYLLERGAPRLSESSLPELRPWEVHVAPQWAAPGAWGAKGDHVIGHGRRQELLPKAGFIREGSSYVLDLPGAT